MFDTQALCPTCHRHSIMMIDRFGDGTFVGACYYCDMPQEDIFAYENRCWNCGYGIDSRFNKPSPIPDMGYVCGWCGKDLTEWKLRHGLITVTELEELNRREHVAIL